jgi:two-component system, NarL family, sensor histidine kinase UhpB
MKDLKILYLEDSEQDAEMTARVLKKAGIPFQFEVVDNQDEYENALRKSRPDLVLADHSLYHFNSVEALKIFRSLDLKVPFILVTGTVSEEFAVNILKEGANDYLLKSNLSRLPNAILNSLEKFRIEEERQKFLENVVSNEALLKEVEHMASIGSWEVDLKNRVVKWSDEVYRIYGYEPGEIEPGIESFIKHFHMEDKAQVKIELNKAIEEKSLFETEFRIIDNKGRTKYIRFKMAVERDSNKKAVRLVGFNHDITQMKEAELKALESIKEVASLEKKLTEQKLERQKLITEVTIQAQEKERNELGKELHDNINQILTTVKMYLNLHMDKPDSSVNLVKKSHDFLAEAIEEIRKLSRTLITPTLGDIGLKESLFELKEEIQLISDLKIQFDYELPDTELDDNQKLILYRIVQEQMNNIIKHAKAKTVKVLVSFNNNETILVIEDDGVGFDPGKKAKGIGLKNIHSRVQFYSGHFNIYSSPGKGCRVEVRIPVKNEVHERD